MATSMRMVAPVKANASARRLSVAASLGLVLLAAEGIAWGEAPGRWTQPTQRMPAAGAAAADAAPGQVRPSTWIWGADENKAYRLRKTFQGGVRRAEIVATADNRMKLSLNGAPVASSDAWERPVRVDVTKLVRDGENELIENRFFPVLK
jgi:hypothetical protein